MTKIIYLVASILLVPLLTMSSSVPLCKNIIGDPGWPSLKAWSNFNASVGGRLIQTVPLATPCHGSALALNSDQCANIKLNWHDPDFHEPSSSSVMSAVFSNRSCDPFETSRGCTLGTYVAYTVDVLTRQHVIKAIAFASANNLRFVIRNTGHDYMGKSTGHSALSVWMHNLKDTDWMPSFSSASYNGPAVKLGAGVTIDQVNQEASERGFVVITGDCPSVGVVGGYIQGGGAGPLSTQHGLLADNVLAFEVITLDGNFVHASPTENSDLFWALSGGGGGTYGIVWSAIVRVFPDTSVTGATLQFSTGANVSIDRWWEGVAAYRLMTANLTAIGGYSLALYTSGSFSMSPLLLFNSNPVQLAKLLGPMLGQLQSLGIPFSLNITSFDRYTDAHNTLFPQALFSVQNTIVGGRLLARSLWDSPNTLHKLNNGIRSLVDNGVGAYDITVAPTLKGKNRPNNAVLPQWRTTQAEFAFFLPWNDTGTESQYQQQQDTLTNVFTKTMKEVSPDSGAYLNEADAFDPDWKLAFYGANYDRLLQLKDKFDPTGLLYGSTAVGGDRWVEIGGRLCRKV